MTKLVLLTTVILLVAYDLWALSHLPAGDTISATVLRWSLSRPVIPFGLGLLMGHLLWPQK